MVAVHGTNINCTKVYENEIWSHRSSACFWQCVTSFLSCCFCSPRIYQITSYMKKITEKLYSIKIKLHFYSQQYIFISQLQNTISYQITVKPITIHRPLFWDTLPIWENFTWCIMSQAIVSENHTYIILYLVHGSKFYFNFYKKNKNLPVFQGWHRSFH